MDQSCLGFRIRGLGLRGLGFKGLGVLGFGVSWGSPEPSIIGPESPPNFGVIEAGRLVREPMITFRPLSLNPVDPTL